MNKKFFVIFILFVFLMTSALGCKKKTVEESTDPIELTYWRVYDGEDDFDQIIQAYNTLHPYITINYKKLRYDEYEEALLNAFAEDRGPDIFSIHNTWMKKYESKLEPLPSQTSMIYQVEQGTIKKELVSETRTSNSITLKELKQNFADVVYSDVVSNNKIYGLPLSVDTLAMYYNQSLFDQAGIVSVPKYWNAEFQQTVKKLTKQDSKGNITQSGVALGGSTNIERYSDILSVLMMQNGADMMSDSGQVLFNTVPASFTNSDYNPGLMALNFYTDFANPIKEVYSWNNTLDNSTNAFASGKLAIMFGYSYHLETIKALAPKLNFFVSSLPQIEGVDTPINFANYWVEVVSKKSQHTNEAWDFVQFLASADQVTSYLEKTNKPAALRSLISKQTSDDNIGVFANQTLTSKSWYKGKNATLMENFIAQMIDEALSKTTEETMSVMNLYASRIQQTVN